MAAFVLFLSGPPKAGKSRLRGDIYRFLATSGRRSWFVQAFSPDCEGQWVHDAHALGRGEEAENRARSFKNALKKSGAFFSPAFVMAMCRQLRGLCAAFELVVADLGGLPSPENGEIVGAAEEASISAVVLLGPDGGDGGWIQWWRARGVEPFVARYREDLAEEVLALHHKA